MVMGTNALRHEGTTGNLLDMKLKLRPYQRVGIYLINKFNGRVLLADEQGLGKTIQVLEWLRRNPANRPAIIVCPASVKYVWEDQAREHCGLRTTVCQGQKPPKKKALLHTNSIYIINYDILIDWCRYLRTLHPSVVVFDEVQRIKNRSKKIARTRAAQLLCSPMRRMPLKSLELIENKTFEEDAWVSFKDVDGTKVDGFIKSVNHKKEYATIRIQIPHIMGLSGTPLTNRPSELWSCLNLIWPQYFPAFWTFAQDYCEPEMTPYGWKFSGASNLGKLHRVLKRIGMIRRRKKDVAKDLPTKQVTVVPMDINNHKEYKEAVNDFINWLSRKDTAKAERASRAKKITQMAYLKRLAAKGKLKSVLNWIDCFLEESDSKLVLGCMHHEVVDIIYDKYKKISVKFTGKTPPKHRRQAVMEFRKNPQRRLFIGQIHAAGTGVDGLQEVAHTSVVVELPWDPGTLSQFFDRIHRIGQNQNVNIYIPVAKGTLEERLCQIIQEKQDNLTNILDGKEETSMRFDIYDQLEKEILKGK